MMSYGGIRLHSQERSSPMGQSSSNPSNSTSTSPGSPINTHKPPVTYSGGPPFSQGSSTQRGIHEPLGRPPLTPPTNISPHRSPSISAKQTQHRTVGNSYLNHMNNYPPPDTLTRNHDSDTYNVAKQTENISKPAVALIRHQRQRSSGGADRVSLGVDRSMAPSGNRQSMNTDRLPIGQDRSLERNGDSGVHVLPLVDSIEMSRLSMAASVGSSVDGGERARALRIPSSAMVSCEPISQSAPVLNNLNQKWPHHSVTTPTTTTSGVGSGLDGLDSDCFDDSSESPQSTTPPLPALSPSNTPPITPPPESPNVLDRQLYNQQRCPANHSLRPSVIPSSIPRGAAVSNYILQTTPDLVNSTAPTIKKKPARKHTPGKICDRRNGHPRSVYKGINPSKVNIRNSNGCKLLLNIEFRKLALYSYQ